MHQLRRLLDAMADQLVGRFGLSSNPDYYNTPPQLDLRTLAELAPVLESYARSARAYQEAMIAVTAAEQMRAAPTAEEPCGNGN